MNTDLSKHLTPDLQSLLLVWLHLKCREDVVINKINLLLVTGAIFCERTLPVVAACWLAAEALGVVATGVWPTGPEAGLSPFSSGADFKSFFRSADVSTSSWITPSTVTDRRSASETKTEEQDRPRAAFPPPRRPASEPPAVWTSAPGGWHIEWGWTKPQSHLERKYIETDKAVCLMDVL